MTKLPKLLFGVGSDRSQQLPDLGERELLVLEVLWEGGDATAQAVKSRMPDSDISLSTVQSTLERLFRKHLLVRRKQGRAYRYQATMTKSQLISGLLRDMTQQVARGDLAPMISGFLDYISTEAPEQAGALSKSIDLKQLGDDCAEVNDE